MGRIFWLWGGTAVRLAAMNVGGSVPNAPRRGQDPSLRCKGYGVVMARLRAGHARPLRTAVNGLWTRGAREGGSLPLTARAEQSPAPTHIPFSLRGFGGAWRRITSTASQQSWPARAVVCPAGANIARSPVSLRSTVAPRSQPRNPRLKSGGRPTGVKREQ